MQSYKKWNKGLEFCMSGAEVASERGQFAISNWQLVRGGASGPGTHTAKGAKFAKEPRTLYRKGRKGFATLASFAVNTKLDPIKMRDALENVPQTEATEAISVELEASRI